MNTAENINARQPMHVDRGNIDLAIASILRMVGRRGLVLQGKEEKYPVPESLPSVSQRKKFRTRMMSVIKHPTMRNSNAFLKYYDSKVRYTEKEQAIIDKRKAYTALRKQTEEARVAYWKEKGDFYGGRIRIPADPVKA